MAASRPERDLSGMSQNIAGLRLIYYFVIFLSPNFFTFLCFTWWSTFRTWKPVYRATFIPILWNSVIQMYTKNWRTYRMFVLHSLMYLRIVSKWFARHVDLNRSLYQISLYRMAGDTHAHWSSRPFANYGYFCRNNIYACRSTFRTNACMLSVLKCLCAKYIAACIFAISRSHP